MHVFDIEDETYDYEFQLYHIIYNIVVLIFLHFSRCDEKLHLKELLKERNHQFPSSDSGEKDVHAQRLTANHRVIVSECPFIQEMSGVMFLK